MRFVLIYLLFSSLLMADFKRDNSKEVVIDTENNIMWQDDSSVKNNKQNWSKAIKYCQNLELAGFDDWRVPTFNELYSLSDFSKKNHAISNQFQNIVSNNYWSSTTYSADSSLAWIVNFKYGNDYWNGKTFSNYVRCVRRQSIDNLIIDNENKVKIPTSKVVIQKKVFDEPIINYKVTNKDIEFEISNLKIGDILYKYNKNSIYPSKNKKIKIVLQHKNVRYFKVYRSGIHYRDIENQNSFDIELEDGRNDIRIDAIGNERRNSKNISVRYTRVIAKGIIYELIDNLKLTKSEYYNKFFIQPQKWALVIGIDKYSKGKNGFPPLPASVNDADKVAQSLKSKFGFKKERIFYLPDSKATKVNIVESLDNIIDKAKKGDDLLIFFSGHGTTQGKMVFLVPFDGKDKFSRTLVRIKADIIDYITEGQKLFRHVLLVFDACYSGNVSNYLPKGADDVALENTKPPKYVLDKIYKRGFHIITAGSEDEAVYVPDGGKHSLFTEFFLKGIDGDADLSGNRDGAVTLYELVDYLQNNVRSRINQHPKLMEIGGNNMGEFIFLKKWSD